MPLSTVLRVGFDPDVAHSRGEPKRPAAPQKPRPALPASVEEARPDAFLVIDEGAPSTAGLSILAQALAAYSEN